MADILIIGINHFDPLGRDKIKEVLTQEKQKGFIPDCFCVEWKKEIAQAVIAQRSKFVDYILEKHAGIEHSTAEKLSMSMAYEADSHIELYPDTEVFWLDEKRSVTVQDDSIVNYYIYRENYYVNWHKEWLYKNDLSGLSQMVCAVKDECTPKERDINFPEVVNKAVDLGYTDICCVVGVNHANKEIDGMFAYQLNKQGFNVRIIDTTK